MIFVHKLDEQSASSSVVEMKVADEGNEEEAVTRLSRVGFDNILGHLKGGFKAWLDSGKEADVVDRITAEQFAKEFRLGTDKVIDVRRESEFKTEHLVGADSFPLDFLNRNMSMLDNRKTYYVHCAGGYRSLIAVSILKSRGFTHLINIKGGYKALSQTRLQRTEHVEVNTEL